VTRCITCSDRLNLFDGFIVTASLAEIAISPPMILGSAKGGGAVTIFRLFRLFRVVKFVRQWASLRLLLETVAKTVKDVVNLALLLVLFIYVFALVGMQFFANRFCFDPETGSPIPGPPCAEYAASWPVSHVTRRLALSLSLLSLSLSLSLTHFLTRSVSLSLTHTRPSPYFLLCFCGMLSPLFLHADTSMPCDSLAVCVCEPLM
jgi:hypothetical protein